MTEQPTTVGQRKKVSRVTRFDRDVRRLEKRGWDIGKLRRFVKILAAGERLPQPARPHRLVGKERDWWEAHVGPDWLLIYEISGERLILIRTGTHSDLFR